MEGPGAAATLSATAHAPRPAAAGKREASPEVLAKRVKELEVQQQEELKAKAKEAKRRQKELADAKKRIVKELQSASKVVKKGEQEVTKLSSLVGKVEDQTDKARQQQSKQLEQLDASIKKMREKRSTLESALHDKVAQVGEAKGKMAHMEFAAKMIESGVIVPTDGLSADPLLGSTGMTMARSGSMPHIGSTGVRLEPTLLALQEENEHLRMLLEEAHRKLSVYAGDALEGRRGGSPRLGGSGSPKLGSLGSASTGALHRAASSIKDDLNPLNTNRSSLRSAQHSASASTPPMDAPVASHTSSRGVSAPPGYAASAGPVPSHHSHLSEPRAVLSQQSQSASVPSHHSEPRPVLSQPLSVISHPMASTAVASHQSSAAGSAPAADAARRGLLSVTTAAFALGGGAQQPMQGPPQHLQVHVPAGAHQQPPIEFGTAIRLASGIRVVPDANGAAAMHPGIIRTVAGGPVLSGPPAVQYVLRPTSPVSPGVAFRRGVPTEPTALTPQPTLLNGMQQAATPEVKPMQQQVSPQQPQLLGVPAWQPNHLAYPIPQGPRTA